MKPNLAINAKDKKHVLRMTMFFVENHVKIRGRTKKQQVRIKIHLDYYEHQVWISFWLLLDNCDFLFVSSPIIKNLRIAVYFGRNWGEVVKDYISLL